MIDLDPWLERQLAALAALIARLGRTVKPEPEPLPIAGGPVAKPFMIGIAPLNNDVELAWTNALAVLLEGQTAIACRLLSTAFASVPSNTDQVQVVAAFQRARQALLKDEDLDLLLWGDIHEDGYSLWFAPAGSVDDERPGAITPYFKLELTPDQTTMSGDLLALAILTAVSPDNDDGRTLQSRMLPQALETLRDLPKSVPIAWNLEQQRSALTLWAHADATIAEWDADPDRFLESADVYRRALQRLPRGVQGGIDEAQLHRHLAGVLQEAGERKNDAALQEQGVAEFRAAAECLPRALFPTEWGNAQNRMGQALYKLDLIAPKIELLKDSMAAFHAALTAFPRSESPQRWAEVMNNLAQVLEVYGDQLKSPEVLERAVVACRAALEVRDQIRSPLAWASCQNTLGSALFLLDKHSDSTAHLDEAAAAFSAALELFKAAGGTLQAAVTEKNLAHVRRLVKTRSERKVAVLDWAEPIEKPPAS